MSLPDGTLLFACEVAKIIEPQPRQNPRPLCRNPEKAEDADTVPWQEKSSSNAAGFDSVWHGFSEATALLKPHSLAARKSLTVLWTADADRQNAETWIWLSILDHE